MISGSETRIQQCQPSSQALCNSNSNSLPNIQQHKFKKTAEAAASIMLQKPAPRSMRTIRSRIFESEEAEPNHPSSSSLSSSLDEEGEVHPKNHRSRSHEARNRDFSEALRDFYDALSDSSASALSFDISGELLRLATATQDNHHQSHAFQPNGISESNTESSDPVSEIDNEPLGQEDFMVFVRLLVRELGKDCSVQSHRKAATELRFLAKNSMQNRELIAKAGAIWPLVCLVSAADPLAQEAAVTALLNLSLCDENKMEITRAGAIKPLIHALKTGTSVAKQNAACTLLNLSRIDDNKFSIGAAGAIPPLVSLLVNGTLRGKKDAVTTLYSLSAVHQNKERAIRAGAIKPLIELIADLGSGMVDKAVVVLSNLATLPEGKNAIVQEGGIPSLVEVIEEGPQKAQEFATVTLLHLCEDSFLYRTLVSREGAIPPLVALSQLGNSRARKKASLLLQYLRESRQAV